MEYRLKAFLQSVTGVLAHCFLFILLLSTGRRLSGKRKFRYQKTVRRGGEVFRRLGDTDTK
ncbi:hypothetical protein F9222_22825 [Escherichia coli]|nr:hypothetical protein [Escherichia coli]EFO2135563.1 hypothetical protein [Escherichia coli]KAB3086155.1 hypothetical protein F9222_22825 [Escherichia coli]